MYKEQKLKDDLLANLYADDPQNSPLHDAVLESEFIFIDTRTYSNIKWGIYERVLRILCKPSHKKILNDNADRIFFLAQRIHYISDGYVLASMNILATASSFSQNDKDSIVINKTIQIDKTKQMIGEGGFGRVYKHHDPLLEQDFAIKIFDPSSFHESDTDSLKKRFIREGRCLLQLRHKNISAGYDLGEVVDSLYIMMEYIEGTGLIEFLRTSSLDMSARKKLAEQFSSAMAYAHENKVLHRDLSYNNVMVTADGEIKLLDFGFSRASKDTTYDTQRCPVLTVFSPPELAEKDSKYDMRSEVYCIGAILYSIFTGNEFHSQNVSTDLNSEIPKPYLDIILKCLDKNPQERFESAEEISTHIFQIENTVVPVRELPLKNDEFKLDSFQAKLTSEVSEILFQPGHLPNIDSIQNWLAKGLKSVLEENLYVTWILIADMLLKLNGVKQVVLKNNTQAVFLCSDIKGLYEYYLSCDEHKKFYFCKTIQTILTRMARECEHWDIIPF